MCQAVDSLFAILAAIAHLGTVVFGGDDTAWVADMTAVNHAAELLRVDADKVRLCGGCVLYSTRCPRHLIPRNVCAYVCVSVSLCLPWSVSCAELQLTLTHTHTHTLAHTCTNIDHTHTHTHTDCTLAYS